MVPLLTREYAIFDFSERGKSNLRDHFVGLRDYADVLQFG